MQIEDHLIWKPYVTYFDGLPLSVSGRPVTNRAVHLQPSSYHGIFLDNQEYWQQLAIDMSLSWALMITSGDSCMEKRHNTTPCEAWLRAGVQTFIRDSTKWDRGFMNIETVRQTVDLYTRYGTVPIWIVGNESFDSREWVGKVPPREEAWQIVCEVWSSAAEQIVNAGAYVAFPDGPSYSENPFEKLRQYGSLATFVARLAGYAGHYYSKGRAISYPYDNVSQLGEPITEEEITEALDDFAYDPAWREETAEKMNELRTAWAAPGKTAIDDDVCFNGWVKVADYAIKSLGFIPPMMLTEGGWVPRDRAGSGNVIDYRWCHSTPKMVATRTLEMFEADTPMFVLAPWLLASGDLGGSGWEFDCWHGWAFSDQYGSKKPVIDTLINNPPGPPSPIDVEAARVDFRAATVALNSFLRNLGE